MSRNTHISIRDPDGRIGDAVEAIRADAPPKSAAPTPSAVVRKALELGLPLVAYGRGGVRGKALATRVNSILTPEVTDAE